MLDREYIVLGLTEYCSDEELDSTYLRLKKQLEEDRFLDGEAGNAAAKRLTEVNAAYNAIKNYRMEHAEINEEGLFKQVDEAIKAGDTAKAQQLLDAFNERPAEWHYLQSVVFYKKNWVNESKKQLEIAKEMDPKNEKYRKALDRMNEKINSGDQGAKGGESWARSGSFGGGAAGNSYSAYDEPQMGGNGCVEYCCQLLACNMCLNCLCNCR